eukprot:5848971-Ditylum_brightwellii.AAC.1
MLRVEGRYNLALGMLDDVFYEKRGVLGVALFDGAIVWLGASIPHDVCDSDAVAVFALLGGFVGNGFEGVIVRQREEKSLEDEEGWCY